MANIIKLGMVFDENSMPDFGDIAIDKNGNFILTNGSLTKLLINLTRDVCGATFNVAPGTLALVADTGAVFVYHAADRWYMRESASYDQSDFSSFYTVNEGEWKNPEKYHAGYIQVKVQASGESYVMSSTENMTFSVSVGNTILITKTLTADNYAGDGYYVTFLSVDEAEKIKKLTSYTMTITVSRGATDITDTLTIAKPKVKVWQDIIKEA